jgi:Na+-translocating ferredoxin:NAD+ oxidoreductase RnfG subunit
MKNKIYVFLASILLLLNACEDVIEVKLSDEDVNMYAVEAKITTEENPYVHLYKTQVVSSDEPYQGISNAVVSISDNSTPPKTIQLVESNETPGLYVPIENEEFKGETGKEYTVTISTNGTVLTATDLLAKVEPIDSIKVHSSLRGDHRFLGVFTFGNETPGLGNYYKWDIYINNELLNAAEYLVIASDELVEGNYVNGFEIFTDFHDPNDDSERLLQLGDTVQVKQTSISEFSYYYYYQMFNQSQSGGMFSVPPANIESNFTASDGSTVVGLFSAHDVSDSNKIIIDDTIESQLRD